MDDTDVAAILDAIYDAAVSPQGWRDVLTRLSTAFDSHFVDLFARTQDWSLYRGVALGLDREDYEQGLLETWCKRNVWAKARPVRVAGEVLATWQMVEKAAVLHSDMYVDYLHKRDMGEGMRLSLWTDARWIQDISLIRPWRRGPFSEAELALGRTLLPHLQRAASLARRLAGSASLVALNVLNRPALLIGHEGHVLRQNAQAEAMLAAGHVLSLRANRLRAASPANAARLHAALAAAAGADGRPARAASLALPSPPGLPSMQLDFLPVRDQTEWALPMPRAVLVIASDPAPQGVTPQALAERFGLTPAEAGLALALLAGRSLAQFAADSGRSVNTLRSHLARIMAKTETNRQGELISLLASLSTIPTAEPPLLRLIGDVADGWG